MDASFHGVDLTFAALKTGQDLFYGLYAAMPFLVSGIITCRRWRFFWAIAVMGMVTFLFGEKFMDVPVQLPTWMLISVIVAMGVQRVSWWSAVIALGIVGTILVASQFVPAKISDHLPSPLMLIVYCSACATAMLMRSRAIPIALSVNLVFIAYNALQVRTELATFAANIERWQPANWNEMVRRNWIVCGSPYCNNQH